MTNPQIISFIKAYLKGKIRIISMMILFLCIGTGICISSPFTYSQITKLSLAVNNKSIKEIFTEIEKNSEYIFFYYDDVVDINRKASINVKDQTIDKILDQLFETTNNMYVIDDRQVFISTKGPGVISLGSASRTETAQQQTKTVVGTVTDSSGDPLIGVSVLVKGTNEGAITNIEGKYSVSQVSSGTTLVFRYMGFSVQEIVVGDRNTINIQLLEDSKQLEEVVVVGYGVQKKETLSGAVTAIRSEEIVTTKTENFISNIQGKIAGLQIRQQTGEPGLFDNMISVRGYGEPLIIIDGVTVKNITNSTGTVIQSAVSQLAQLASEDIESISILKDASAAIYGMNSANGAILITTKKGSSQGKARFSYSGLYGLKSATGMEMTMDAYNYMLAANEMQRNDGKAMYAAFTEDMLNRYKNNEPGYQDTDWLDLTLHKVVSQQNHNLSVRGGNDRAQYFVSAGFTDDNGLLKYNMQYYKRYNFRASITAAITNDLKMNVQFSGRQDTQQRKRDDFWAILKAIYTSERYKAPYTMDGKGGYTEHYSYLEPEGKNLLAFINPEVDGYRRTETHDGDAKIDLTYTAPFLKGLTLNALASYNINQSNLSQLQRSYRLYDYYTDVYRATYGTDFYNDQITLYSNAYLRLMATYNKRIDSHSFNIMGAMEASKNRTDQLYGQRLYSDLFTNDILNQGTATTATNSGYRHYGRLAAYIGRINYDFAGKYLVELVGRYDGSFRYAPEKRWVFFPSASIGWRMSEEQFIKDNLTFLANLKLRASYGESGRDTGNPFQYIPGYTMGSARGYIFDTGVFTTGMYPPGVVNNLMSWVTSKNSNVGIDFDLQSGKFGGAFDIFRRKTTGILAQRNTSVPNFFGASFPYENLNSDENFGMDMSLNHQGKVGKDFKYYITGNVTYARQRKLHVEAAEFTSQWARYRSANASNRLVGRSLIYKYNGQYSSLKELETAPLSGGTLGNSKMLPGEFRILDMNGDGIINANDQVYDNWAFGTEGYVSGAASNANTSGVNPPLQFGFTFAGTYKAFSLNLLFQGAALYSVNFAQNDVFGYGRYPALHDKYADHWHTANIADDPYDPTTVWIPGKFAPLRPWVNPRPGVTSDNMISLFRPMGNYIRLKNIELGYTVPRSLLKKWNLGDVRLFVNTTNVLTFTTRELRKLDPEKQEKDYNANLTYPIMKAVNFGLNLNF